MRIRDFMTTSVTVVNEETTIIEAKKMMKEKKIRRLPVMNGNRLVGLVTERMLLDASPPKTSTFNSEDLKEMSIKSTIDEVMVQNPVTVSSDLHAEDALQLGQEMGIGGFPVVDNNTLVGIVTESDIVRMMTRIIGVKDKGVRIDLRVRREFGNLEKISRIIDSMKIPLLSMMMFDESGKNDICHVFLRLKTDIVEDVVKELIKKGFDVTDPMMWKDK